ncbi:MAG: GNAT family N-acetyltransferase [Methylovulum sp.]|nr:GNAT family N-acetyltransferase [Methylovulum sp.]
MSTSELNFTDICLRTEISADEAFLRLLYASTRANEMAFFPWPEAQKTVFLHSQFNLQHQQYRHHYPTANFSIILFKNNPVGRWYVHRGADVFQLIDISLLAGYRNQGLGSHLLATLTAEARAQQKTVRLHVQPINRALKLYQRMGFVTIEKHDIYWLMEWQPQQ